MMTKTIAGVLAVSLFTGAASCGKRKKSRWNPPAVEQTEERNAYPVCWSDLSNLPCVVETGAGRGVLHQPTGRPDVAMEQEVLLVLRLENGDWRVQPA